MTLAFLVNRLSTERAVYSTSRLALAALEKDHRVLYIGPESFSVRAGGAATVHARVLDPGMVSSLEELVEALADEEERQDVAIRDLDVLFLRSDPAEETGDRTWAQMAGVEFGFLASAAGVLVLNDPTGLTQASSKMYLSLFPEDVVPRTLISRDRAEVRAFIEDLPKGGVIKPLRGSGGERVFSVTPKEMSNFNQMFDAVHQTGYVIAQEFLPDASRGDIRMFLMNGKPLEVDGVHAAFRRVGDSGDLRNNMSAGGKAEAVEITDDMLAVAEAVRPRLIADGMFLVGLDLVGAKILEVNVFSPGGLGSAGQFGGVDFAAAVIEAIELKIHHVGQYEGRFENRQLACL